MLDETDLIHRVRTFGYSRAGARDEEGSRESSDPVYGPWIPAFVLERGGPASKRRGQNTIAATVQRGYEIVICATDENNAVVPPIEASMVLQTDCPVLGNPTIEMEARAEVLNDGDELIGYLAFGDVPGDAA